MLTKRTFEWKFEPGVQVPTVAALQLVPANHLDARRMHRVGAGGTLAAIAKRYGVMPANIVSVDRLESAQAVEGDRLLIPAVQQAPLAKKAVWASARSQSTTRGKSTATAAARPVRKAPVGVARNTGN